MKVNMTIFLLVIGMIFLSIGMAFSVPPGKELVFEDGKMVKLFLMEQSTRTQVKNVIIVFQ